MYERKNTTQSCYLSNAEHPGGGGGMEGSQGVQSLTFVFVKINTSY